MSRLVLAAATLSGSAAASATDPAAILNRAAPALCRQLQEQGWQAPADPTDPRKRSAAEINVPGVMYLCMLEQTLPGKGSGRAPDLQALLSADGKEPGMVFSADVWCEADRTAALDSLASRIGTALERAALPLPADVAAALRAGRAATVTSHGVTFTTKPIDVDAGACAKVGPGQLGAVLFKLDLSVKPAG